MRFRVRLKKSLRPWIPAFAGMTVRGAGLTVKGAGMTAMGAGITFIGVFTLLASGAYAEIDEDDIETQIDFEQRLGAQIPIDATFQNEDGETIAFRESIGERPALLALVYYECPMLCTLILNGLIESLKEVEFNPGEEFEVIALSIDPGETPELAHAKRLRYLANYNRPGTERGWHFLTGEQSSIDRVADAAGYRYTYDPETDLYAHASGFVVLSPSGKITHYFYGVSYPPRDLKLALMEASEGTVGNPVERLILRCYHYDPESGKYGLAIMNIVRFAGIATFLALMGIVLFFLRRERNGSEQTAPIHTHKPDEAGV